MKIAFVGIEKDWNELEKRNYTLEFIRYHLELPYYYSRYGCNDVDIISDTEWGPLMATVGYNSAALEVIRQKEFNKRKYDVVIHWRKWIEEGYHPEAINVINSQDHSYTQTWLSTVEKATAEEKLQGILCFPKWHEDNLRKELASLFKSPTLLSGVTLGVDTDTYRPIHPKSRYDLLWASDPGRGLVKAVELGIKLWNRDNRFKLHVCYPDYVDNHITMDHPALTVYRCIKNGPELWNLFNTCGFLPYTSTFKEPSSRAHRQAMAAGSVVLYPPNMGTPSDLILSGVNGLVYPIDDWADLIIEYAESDQAFNLISDNARLKACSENWKVQAKRFNNLFENLERSI